MRNGRSKLAREAFEKMPAPAVLVLKNGDLEIKAECYGHKFRKRIEHDPKGKVIRELWLDQYGSVMHVEHK